MNGRRTDRWGHHYHYHHHHHCYHYRYHLSLSVSLSLFLLYLAIRNEFKTFREIKTHNNMPCSLVISGWNRRPWATYQFSKTMEMFIILVSDGLDANTFGRFPSNLPEDNSTRQKWSSSTLKRSPHTTAIRQRLGSTYRAKEQVVSSSTRGNRFV